MWSVPNSCIRAGTLTGAPLPPSPQPPPHPIAPNFQYVLGRSPPVQVKEHSVIYVNGSIFVGLHPAVFDIKLTSNFIRIKYSGHSEV